MALESGDHKGMGKIIPIAGRTHKRHDSRLYRQLWIVSACYAIDHCLNGQKARTKYIEKPIRLFEMTEEEKKKEQEKALSAFIGWAEFTKDEFDRQQK